MLASPLITHILPNAASHAACSAFLNQEHWSSEFNDKLYESGQPAAAWHLQGHKSDVLSRWQKHVGQERQLALEALAGESHPKDTLAKLARQAKRILAEHWPEIASAA